MSNNGYTTDVGMLGIVQMIAKDECKRYGRPGEPFNEQLQRCMIALLFSAFIMAIVRSGVEFDRATEFVASDAVTQCILSEMQNAGWAIK